MDNSFTRNGYRSLLNTALSSGYNFFDFNQMHSVSEERVCVLRHDIDADLKAAAEMSAIEAELGIRATYFLMLRSPVYNLFGRANHRFVQEIIKNGHYIGLHYDEGFYPDKTKSINELVKREAKAIEEMFNIKINVVSFHQPGEAVLANKVKLENYINTYDKADITGYYYISDSNKVWKRDPFEMFSKVEEPKVQMLIHPMWWITDKDLPTEELWLKALMDNFSRTQQQLLDTERAYGNEKKISLNQK